MRNASSIALALSLLVVAPAGAEELVVQTRNGIAYASGGVGEEGQRAFDRVDFAPTLRLVFAAASGAYLADVAVSVLEAEGGREIVEVTSEGPMLAMKLPPGSYEVVATSAGHAERRSVKVPVAERLVIRFPEGDVRREPAEAESHVAAPPTGGMLLAVGAPFPAWTLVDQDGRAVSSKDLAGAPYLLWFYPKASTPGCTLEGQGLRDRHGDFDRLGVRIVGVSFDLPSENAAFRTEEGLPFPLLSDRERALALAVGAAKTPQQGYARRISYLVGANGNVERVYEDVNPSAHAADVLGDLIGS